MDLTPLIGILLVILLVFINGFFVATEFAIVAVRRSRLEEAANHGSMAAAAAKQVVDHFDAYLATCQVGITVASLALGWIGEPAIASLIEPPIEKLADTFAPALAHTVSIAITFILITTLHIVAGEQAAKGLALQRTEATTLFVSLIMLVLYKLLRWPIALLTALTKGILGLFGMHAVWGEEVAHSVEELRGLVNSSREAGLVEASEARLASRAFEFSDVSAASLMTPRTELEAIPASIGIEELISKAQTASHTRLLVYTDSLDDIIGVVHIRDLLKAMAGPAEAFSMTGLLRPVLTVPESKRADAMLEEMRSTRRHLAVVIEEFSSTAGVVTTRDIIGSLVGRIEDEPQASAPLPAALPTDESGAFVQDGLMRIEEVEEVAGIALDPALKVKADTLGGVVMALLGRIPEVGNRVELDGRVLEVVAKDGMRVATVRVLPVVEPAPL